MKAAISNF